eukprot:PhM_4_TR15632/c0_g1_i1/m.2324
MKQSNSHNSSLNSPSSRSASTNHSPDITPRRSVDHTNYNPAHLMADRNRNRLLREMTKEISASKAFSTQSGGKPSPLLSNNALMLNRVVTALVSPPPTPFGCGLSLGSHMSASDVLRRTSRRADVSLDDNESARATSEQLGGMTLTQRMMIIVPRLDARLRALDTARSNSDPFSSLLLDLVVGQTRRLLHVDEFASSSSNNTSCPSPTSKGGSASPRSAPSTPTSGSGKQPLPPFVPCNAADDTVMNSTFAAAARLLLQPATPRCMIPLPQCVDKDGSLLIYHKVSPSIPWVQKLVSGPTSAAALSEAEDSVLKCLLLTLELASEAAWQSYRQKLSAANDVTKMPPFNPFRFTLLVDFSDLPTTFFIGTAGSALFDIWARVLEVVASEWCVCCSRVLCYHVSMSSGAFLSHMGQKRLADAVRGLWRVTKSSQLLDDIVGGVDVECKDMIKKYLASPEAASADWMSFLNSVAAKDTNKRTSATTSPKQQEQQQQQQPVVRSPSPSQQPRRRTSSSGSRLLAHGSGSFGSIPKLRTSDVPAHIAHLVPTRDDTPKVNVGITPSDEGDLRSSAPSNTTGFQSPPTGGEVPDTLPPPPPGWDNGLPMGVPVNVASLTSLET